jgi:cytochrome c oxidase cbb3-type subunit 3/ubiquinol-cytochrome c reductase cytochrome c subunit
VIDARRSVRIVSFASLLLASCARRPPSPPPRAQTPAAAVKGSRLYATYCATCHGRDRNGYSSDNAPSLRTATFLATASDAFLSAAVTRGRPGTAMAAFGRALGGPLPPEDVTALVAFLRRGAPPPIALAATAVAGDVAQGSATYANLCVRCHGTASQRSSAVHLANPILLQTASDAFLRYAVTEGRAPTSMVPWKGALAPKQIDDVVAYVRSLSTAPPVPAAPPPVAAQPPRHSLGPPTAPREGPIVLNPRGRAPEFTLKDDLYVSIDQVKAALDARRKMIIADARPPSEWLNLRIKGAISTPFYDVKSLDDLPNDGTWIVAYCACPHHLSGTVVEALRSRGYRHTAVLDEGIFAWQQKKYPVIAAPGMSPPPSPPPVAPPAAPTPSRAPPPTAHR